jgi:hypothetical protein
MPLKCWMTEDIIGLIRSSQNINYIYDDAPFLLPNFTSGKLKLAT